VKGVLHRVAAIGAACLISASLEAAPAPTSPTPGQVQSTLPTQPAQPKKAPPPSVSGAPTNAAGVAPGGPTFKVTGFTIEGNSIIPTDELQAQIASYVGQTLTLAQLYDVSDVLTRYYRAKGYGLAYVAPPAQKITTGNVRLQVVEGRIGNINIQGNDRTRTAMLARRTQGLDKGDVYTDAAAERAALLMGDLPGVQSHITISPGADSGTSDLLFDVNERHYGGDASVDDYGRAAIGRWRVNVDAYIDSLTGSGDQLSGGITHSEGNLLNFGKLAYLFPTGADSSLTTSFNRAFYHVGGPQFGALGIEGSTQTGSVNWQYAQIRTQEKSLFWGVGLSHNTAKSAPEGVPTTVTTNITLLQLSMIYDRQWKDQSTFTLNGNFWTNGKSNADANLNDAEKFHFEFDAGYNKPFAENWLFTGQGSVAYSPDPLVDGDKYSLGGPGSVRGFQSAEARGDRGLFASGEVQRGIYHSDGGYALSWGVFVDAGEVWTQGVDSTSIVKGKPVTTTTVKADSTKLTSIGTEFLLTPPGSVNGPTGWNARLQFAWAVGAYRPSDDLSAAEIKNGVAPHDKGPHIWFTFGRAF
jgi:hemolysin activation/secretion protein